MPQPSSITVRAEIAVSCRSSSAERPASAAFLDGAPETCRDEAATLLDVVPQSASRILAALARGGGLVPVAHTGGPRVRYRLP